MEQDQHLRQDYPEQPRRRTLLNRLWALIGLLAFIELSMRSTVTLRQAAGGSASLSLGQRRLEVRRLG